MITKVPLILTLFLFFDLYPSFSEESYVQVGQSSLSKNFRGYTQTFAEFPISSPYSGKVIKINYREGEKIGEAPFLELDTLLLDLKLKTLEGELNSLKSNRKILKLRLDQAKKEVFRVESLYKRKIESLSQLEKVRLEVDLGQAEIESLEKKMVALESGMVETQGVREKYRVFLPLGWTLLSRNVEPFQEIQVGNHLGKVGELRQLKISLFMSEPWLEVLPKTRGGEIRGRYQNSNIPLFLDLIHPTFNSELRKRQVDLLWTPTMENPKEGMVVEFTLLSPGEDFLIPKAAVDSRFQSFRVKTLEDEVLSLYKTGENSDHFLVGPHPKLKLGLKLKIHNKNLPTP